MDLIDLRALTRLGRLPRTRSLARAPDVVGVTMMSVDYNPATEAAAHHQGGPARRSSSSSAGRTPPWRWTRRRPIPDFDYIVTHEGEITFLKLLARHRATGSGRPSA